MSASVIVLVTGANTGIGLETVKALYASSEIVYDVILAGRSFDKAQTATKALVSDRSKSTITPLQLDLSDDTSISAAFATVEEKFGRIDVLVNNAGASFDNTIKTGKMTTRQGWNESWDTNVTGTHIVTETFVPLLLKSSDPRLIFITSGTSSLAETEDPNNRLNIAPQKGWPKQNFFSIMSYRSAKAGLNMMMREWTRILREDGVKVWAIAPGFLATGLGGDAEALKKMGAGDPSEGGVSIKKVIEGHRDADEGKVVRNYGTPVQPW